MFHLNPLKSVLI